MTLVDACKYSFEDLIYAAGKSFDLDILYKLPQSTRNKIVKELCEIVGWYWEDVRGTNDVIYTAFSPIRI